MSTRTLLISFLAVLGYTAVARARRRAIRDPASRAGRSPAASPSPAARDVTLPAGGLKRIHVSRQTVQRFQETGADEPAWMIRTRDGVYRCRGWTVAGEMVGVQSLTEPLLGGKARLWLETREAIRMSEAILLDPRASEVEERDA